MSLKLVSLLVYTVGVKCRGLSATETYAPEHIFSLSESRANRTDPRALVRHTQGHMVRIYPKGTRVNSTNYEPVKYWAVGAQLVAINWQTFGRLTIFHSVNEVILIRVNQIQVT